MSRITLSVAVLACALLTSAAALSANDIAVLNFALNLEYLEANFYSCAAYGKPISNTLWGPGGRAPVGCLKANVSGFVWQLADELAEDEIAHVKLLRAVLGSAAVDQPLLDLGPAFTAAANAAASLALGTPTTLVPPFSPYSSGITFLHGAFIFEDVGATAYAGALAAIDDPGYLTAAGQILGVESYHAGAVRGALAKQLNDQVPFTSPPGLRVRDVVGAISDLRDLVDGSSDDDQGIVRPNSSRGINLVPTDDNGLIYTRGTSQVLRIVYLGGLSSGGFFPNGLNGAIKVAS